jgi:hypothetical protein
MDSPVQHYWNKRLSSVKEALEANNFRAFVVEDAAQARSLVLDTILPEMNPGSVSWGGSMTFIGSGLYDELKSRSDLKILDAYDKALSPEQSLETRRQALLVDLFFAGTNAITENGQLVNLDMIGNRVGAITFGPKHVVILAGRNKVVGDLDEAMYRVKNFAAPANSIRLDKKTPCAETGYCAECKSPDRICNAWTIHEKSFPKGRIKVVLINQDLGL